MDGQQRLTAVIEYAGDHFPARHPKYDKPMKYSRSEAERTASVPPRHRWRLASLSLEQVTRTSLRYLGASTRFLKTLNPQEKRNAFQWRVQTVLPAPGFSGRFLARQQHLHRNEHCAHGGDPPVAELAR